MCCLPPLANGKNGTIFPYLQHRREGWNSRPSPAPLPFTNEQRSLFYFNEVCEKWFMLESSLFPLLMTASASEWKLKCRKMLRGFQNVHMSICAVLSQISLLENLLCRQARAVWTLRRGDSPGKLSSNFPIVCFQLFTLGETVTTAWRWQPVPVVYTHRCVFEKAGVIVASLLCPASDSQTIVYLKIKQQETK